MNILQTVFSTYIQSSNYFLDSLHFLELPLTFITLGIMIYEFYRSKQFRRSEQFPTLTGKIQESLNLLDDEMLNISKGSYIYYSVTFATLFLSLYLINLGDRRLFAVTTTSFLLRTTLLITGFALINLFYIRMFYRGIHSLSLRVLPGNNIEKESSEKQIFGSVIRSTWLLSSTTLFSHLFFVMWKLILGPLSIGSLFPNTTQETLMMVFSMLNLGTLGILVAKYIYSVSFQAKAADILGDSTGSKEFKKIDKLCDVSADGTFSKLIALVIMETISLQEGFLMGPFLLANLISWVLSQYFSNSEEGKINLRQNLKEIGLAFFVVCLLSRNVKSMIFFVTVLGVTSPCWVRQFKDLIAQDKGFTFLFPLLSSMMVTGSGILTLGLTSYPKAAFEFLPFLLMLDQTGYIFDLLGEENPEMDFLDLLGNQYKALFKFFATKLLAGKLAWSQTPDLGHLATTSTLFQTGIQGFIFWHNISKLKDIDHFPQVKDRVLLQGLAVLPFDVSNCEAVSDTLILHGAIADNLKKSYQLKLIKGDEKIVSQVEYTDLTGDFTKDFLYPSLIFRSLLSVAFGMFQNFFLELRLVLEPLFI